MSTADTTTQSDSGPAQIDGPPAAGLIAAGIGALTLGLFTTLAEASTGIKDFLQMDDGVGPLAGKTILAAVAYFAAFVILGFVWRGKSFPLRAILIATGVLVALGLLMTFPPVFQAFASG